MQNLNDAEQQWKDEAFASFFNMVKAPDGDFDAIARLSQALSDVDSLKIMVEFLSRHQQGKQAFRERHRLENIVLTELISLPQNTLGYIYADHMIKNIIDLENFVAQPTSP